MPFSITRRDFLNGFAVSVASGITPLARLRAAGRYPPALTGMRGQHPGAFEVAHELARAGKTFPIDGLPVDERYDLVVVGGGISGLAAAYFYRRAAASAGRSVRILVLDNHDDFGGHAKRNEFRLGGRLILGYGGSESLQSPKSSYSRTAKALLADLRVDIGRFETAFERRLYPSLGLSRGVFFDRETFGRDALVPGDPTPMVDDDLSRALSNARPVREFVDACPLSQTAKRQLAAVYERKDDPLAGKPADEKASLLSKTSYRDYLVKVLGCGEEVANFFQGRTCDFFGIGCDAVAAADAREAGYPGFAGIELADDARRPDLEEPYIYHFRDGNASLARLLVRALVPGVAPGETMDDIVLAPFDYDRLDTEGAEVRIRLDSTCVHVANRGSGVDLGYVRAGRLHRVEARHAVLACFNMIIPHLMPGLPEEQRHALSLNVKAPMVYTKVLTRDWRAWTNLGVHEICAPTAFHTRVKLDYPVTLGNYRHSREPSEPMCLHLVHVPGAPNRGLDSRDQFRIGRQALFETSFDQFEDRIRDQLDRMLGSGGFASGRDIAAITVNRWSHGYSYTPSTLFDGEEFASSMELARRPAGRVAIANSDARWDAYAHAAIDEADRAVREVLAAG
jgi:spermidine dehydrogenase